ncbi:MAG: hypothetical protein U0521_17280 [Anaerolineae bacterium]
MQKNIFLHPHQNNHKHGIWFLLIAQAADELGEGSKEGDIAERSREILNNDIPEYLMRRMRGDYSDVEK